MPISDRYQKIKEYLMGSQDPDELRALEASEQSAQDARNIAGIGSGFDKIISSIGGTQANPEPYAQMQKMAGEGPTRVREYLKQKYLQKQDAGKTAATLAAAEESADATRAQRDFTRKMGEENLALRKQQADLDREKFEKEKNKPTPGEQAIEVATAKEVHDWDSSEKQKAQQGLDRLKLIKESLATKQDSTIDRLRARAGHEGLLSDADLKIKQDVMNAALPILKATFGSQLSDAERTSLAASYYDPRLSAKDNVANIEKKIAEAEESMAQKDARAAAFKGGLKHPISEPPPMEKRQEVPSAGAAPLKIPPGMKLQVNTKTGEKRLVPR